MSALVLLSGGLDSAVALAWAVEKYPRVRALTVDYGQRHAREISSAKAIADHHQVAHTVVEIRPQLKPIDPRSPHGEGTVVSGRNLMLIGIAFAWASKLECQSVVFSPHQGDAQTYQDCRQEFVESLRAAVTLGVCNDAHLETPFLGMNKAEVVLEGLRLGSPLGLSWSCYTGESEPCRECGACTDRAEAFSGAGQIDPGGSCTA
jgi:7-cyano-7-deazaguanine synthase